MGHSLQARDIFYFMRLLIQANFQRTESSISSQIDINKNRRREEAEHVPPGGRGEAPRPCGWSFCLRRTVVRPPDRVGAFIRTPEP
jgi:hypothetical protein